MQPKHNKQLVPLAKQLRKEMTKEERHLWYDYLRNKDVRFLRQKIIGSYIVDFYCAKASLVIELDGSQHYEDRGIEYDTQRTKYLEQCGLTVVRIPNNEINSNFNGVCDYLDDLILVPFGIMLVLRLVPAEVMQRCRLQADAISQKPSSYIAASVFIGLRVLLA